jgi:ABC-type uncharacterized transport system permease subunit
LHAYSIIGFMPGIWKVLTYVVLLPSLLTDVLLLPALLTDVLLLPSLLYSVLHQVTHNKLLCPSWQAGQGK